MLFRNSLLFCGNMLVHCEYLKNVFRQINCVTAPKAAYASPLVTQFPNNSGARYLCSVVYAVQLASIRRCTDQECA